MDTLKGKQIMVWTFMGNTRMYQALRDYGDRISQIGLFSFKVRATGEIYESGVSIAAGSTMRTYISKWPHIKWLLTVANDGTNSIFKALRENTDGAQDMFLSELVRIMEKYPWCDGVDIDLEKGDDYSTAAKSTAMFRNIYNTVKSYDSTKLMNICLPGMDSINGSVGGENWCVYGDLNNYCDTASIMSYGMAWAGSAPGPVSPRSWLEGIYDYAVKVMNPDKVFLGMPAYGWNWRIHDTPKNMGVTYRGTSNTYYAAQLWMTGGYNFTDDKPPQPFIPIVAYWDDYDKVPWALPHVYDYMEGRDAVSHDYPLLSGTYNRRHYLTAYGKEQKTEFENILVDRSADNPSSAAGIISIENGVAVLGDLWTQLGMGYTMDGFRKAVKAAMGSAASGDSGTAGYTQIMGNAVATAEQMRNYIKAKNPKVAQSVLDMVPLYLSEGGMEGVRGDIAFAQSCLETGNFGFSGSAVTLSQNNFCGMGVTSNGVKGNSFDTPQLGIRAQVQHLKAYASTDALKNACIDPCFKYVTRGWAEYVEWLGQKENPNGKGWAAGAGYGEKILAILKSILGMDGGASSGSVGAEVWYRVRKTWADASSQKGTFKSLENAKKCADENPGYSVFDESGKAVYTKAAAFKPYLVRVTIPDLNIRKGPGTDYGKTGKYTGIGTFTIVEEADGEGASKWGLLKSYQKKRDGWVSLDYAKKV